MELESTQRLERGDEAPAFDLPGADGWDYSLADFDEYEALLVVFTCNHCPYARAKIPELNDIAATYDEVAVVGINPNDEAEYPEDSFDEMRAAVDEGRVEYDAYLRDESQSIAAAYGAVCTPDPFLFEREGDRFRLAYHGRIDDAANPGAEPDRYDVREAIESVLDGEAVDEEFRPSRGCSIKWKAGNEPDYWSEV